MPHSLDQAAVQRGRPSDVIQNSLSEPVSQPGLVTLSIPPGETTLAAIVNGHQCPHCLGRTNKNGMDYRDGARGIVGASVWARCDRARAARPMLERLGPSLCCRPSCETNSKTL